MTHSCQASSDNIHGMKRSKNMQTLMNVVRAFLTENGHRPERRGPNLRTPIRGENGVWYFHVLVNPTFALYPPFPHY